jgi:Photosynthetic reaction centre cytochrome C subunit
VWTSLASLVLAAPVLAGHGQAAPGIPPDVRVAMDAINRALGVECTHCHVEDHWTDATKPAFGTARNMMKMVEAVNRQLSEVGEVRCWTCHGGQVKPSRLPPALLDAELAKWPTGLSDERKLAMAVYDVTLGVSCDHCHSADWKDDGKAPMKMVKRMTALFDEFPKYMPAAARTQCFMCHKGRIKPQRRP